MLHYFFQVLVRVYDVNEVEVIQDNVFQEIYCLENRLPSTLCCAQIWAMNMCDDSYFVGYPINICGRTQIATPDVVTNLMAPDNLIDLTSFGLTWDPPLNFNTTSGVMYDIGVTLFDLTWDPLLNFSTIPDDMYDDSIQEFTVIDTTYIYVLNLEPCTTYTVYVSAYISGVVPSRSSSIQVTTRPPLPPPPQDVTMSIQNTSTPITLMLIWNAPSQSTCDDYNIQTYKIHLRCNDYENETTVSTSLASATIQLFDGDLGLGWCFAQIQSCNGDMACGSFSNQARVSFPPQPPPRPTCYIQSELSFEVTVSFAITEPFLTSNLTVNWMLNSTDQLITDYFTFNVSGSNVFTTTVDSNTNYNFQLEICNKYGCSSPCIMDFTTNVSYHFGIKALQTLNAHL